MIVTEAEAKTLRCCGPEGCGEWTTEPTINLRRMCIGSACMAWRPILAMFEKASGELLREDVPYLRNNAEQRPTGSGFCGYAGG